MPPRHPKSAAFLRLGLFDNLTSFQDLECRIKGFATTQERGDAFEVFTEAYLATTKAVGAKEVWAGSNVPIHIESKLRLSGPLGVDGVYESPLGELCGYQVKYRTGRPSLTFTELSTFMGITDRVDRRVLITNCDDLSEQINDRLGFFCIRGQDLDRLEERDFDAIRTWLAGAIVPREKFTPKPHQADAIEAIVNSLQVSDRATAVMACGTGKTLVTLWTAERMGSRRVIVLVPSLALLDQILHDWLTHTNWERPVYKCVCSDPTVEKGADELVMKQSDLDFPVDTNSENVRRFLQANYDGVRIVFSTYHSANIVAEALKGCEQFDLGIFDEAHKTAGREGTKFSLALKDSELPIRKRLFVTATPRHYDIGKRDKEGDAKLVYSMDVPESYGPRAYTLSFAEAARQGIICNYKVVISIVTSDMVNEELLRHGEVVVAGDTVKARQVANQIALQKAVEETGVSKIITFHRTVDSAKSFTGTGGEGISNHLSAFATDHVRGTMSSSERNRRMTAFRNSPKAIMSNARCLTEGVDVPVIDMVAFIAPKKSRIDIVQATGRAMRKPSNGGKEFGYVLIPLFIEQAKGESLGEAVERTGYEEVWQVMQAMQEQDEDLAETIRQMREERGRTKGYDDSLFKEKVLFIGPEISLDSLRKSITAKCIENLGDNWDERYGELKAFKDIHGHCNVPHLFAENPRLGFWVATQRRRKDGLTQDLIQRLNDLGFVWDPNDAAWEEMFEALVEYKKKTGNCNVPSVFAENPQLGSWVNTQRVVGLQRIKIKRPKLDRISRLEDLGFVWYPRIARWEKMFEALVEYKKKTGNCNVPAIWPEIPQLAKWVAKQRIIKDRLKQDRKQRLNDLGFVWNTLEASWEEMFEKLVEYKKNTGNCNVPARWADNRILGRWVSTQRLKKDRLTPDRIQRLNDLGFVWEPYDAAWEEMFEALVEYKKKTGNCNVPQQSGKNPKLGGWVGRQRQNKDGLTSKQIQRLNDLRFVWNPLEKSFEKMFAALVKYKKKHGNCNVPKGWSENRQLGNWVDTQRQWKERIPPDRIKRFDDLGFVWNPLEASWEAMFEALVKYKKKHGNCKVPVGWPENPSLGSWVVTQRRKKDLLTPERIQRLDDLGFVWEPINAYWEKMFAALVEYKKKHGNCKVPDDWPENPSLGSWVGNQRGKKDRLPPDRIKRLNDLGFVWNTFEASWEEMFEKLVEYKKNTGNCNVPAKCLENPHLGSWVDRQRQKRDRLTPERIQRLDEIGFVWVIRKKK